jgi:hypothetical protein
VGVFDISSEGSVVVSALALASAYPLGLRLFLLGLEVILFLAAIPSRSMLALHQEIILIGLRGRPAFHCDCVRPWPEEHYAALQQHKPGVNWPVSRLSPSMHYPFESLMLYVRALCVNRFGRLLSPTTI